MHWKKFCIHFFWIASICLIFSTVGGREREGQKLFIFALSHKWMAIWGLLSNKKLGITFEISVFLAKFMSRHLWMLPCYWLYDHGCMAGNQQTSTSSVLLMLPSHQGCSFCLGIIHKWRHTSRGKGDCDFCDNIYEGLSETVILVWQRGGGVRKSPNLLDVINGWPLIQQLFNSSTIIHSF